MTKASVWIAERQVIYVYTDGRRVPGQIAIGQPYTLSGRYPSDNYESLCPVDVGEFSPPRAVTGVGTLGALMTAVKYAGSMLQLFRSQGGRVIDPVDGSDIDVTLLFGPLFRDPSDPGS